MKCRYLNYNLFCTVRNIGNVNPNLISKISVYYTFTENPYAPLTRWKIIGEELLQLDPLNETPKGGGGGHPKGGGGDFYGANLDENSFDKFINGPVEALFPKANAADYHFKNTTSLNGQCHF